VGGTVTAAGSHPFQVGLLAKSITRNFNAHFCGGTLVAQRFVVTAAHCTDFVPSIASKAQVLVGTRRLDGTGRRINVVRVHIHPSWDLPSSAAMDYDVAVWELATPVTGIEFATLANTQPSAEGTLLRTSGWGTRIYAVRDKPMDLMQVDVPFVPASGGYCGEQDGVTPRMICAGIRGKDSCQGDSGGPLTINRGAGFKELAGIVSFGDGGCGAEGWPGVYTNVADSSINGFIRRIVFPPPKTIALAAANYSVSEGSNAVTLTVQRSSTQGTAQVTFATADGTARRKTDYRARTGTLSFKQGQATATVTIQLINDRAKERSETFRVLLSRPSSGWTLGSTTATVTIADND
jgi:secreted trypsin-like serine protease